MIGLFVCSLLATASHIDLFDGNPIYQEPLANVRSVETGISVKTSKYRGAQLRYFDALIGKVIPVFRYHTNQTTDVQLAIEAGTWAVLGYDEGAFPLITQDFLLAVPLLYRIRSFENLGDLSLALKYNHISSHRGDGFDLLWESTLTLDEKHKVKQLEEQQGISVAPPVKNYSRDFFSFDLAKEVVYGETKAKAYVSASYAHKMYPEKLKRWSAGNGVEVSHDSGFFLAGDLHYYQDTNSLDYSGQTGWIFYHHAVQPRIVISWYLGSDRRGQFVGRRMQEIGIGIMFR